MASKSKRRWLLRFGGSLIVAVVLGPMIPGAARNQPAATPDAMPGTCTPSPILTLPTPAPDFSPKGMGGEQLWIAMGTAAMATPAAEYSAVAGEYGFGIRMIFLMPPGSNTVASISGKSLSTGAEMRFEIVGHDAATTASLDAANPAIPVQHAGWAEFPAAVWFPENGCYEITATWDGGGWTIQYPFIAANIATPVG